MHFLHSRIMKRLNSSDYEINRDTTIEIIEKSEYQATRQCSLDLLTKSMCPMIQIVMSRCYGTKENCKKMYELLQQKQKSVSKNKKSIQKSQDLDNEINKFAEANMSLRTDCMDLEAFDPELNWLVQCKDILTSLCPKDKSNWDNLAHDMQNWEPSACLSIVIHSKDIHGNSIFKSPLINFPHDTNMYDFVSLAKNVKDLRNNDSHSSSRADIIKMYDEDMHLILKFLDDLKKWYEKNSCTQAFGYANDACMEVNEKYDYMFQRNIPKWEYIYEKLKELDPNSTCYLLFTTPLHFETLTENQKKGLSSVPWCCIVDYDPNSNKEGFLKIFKEHQSQSICCESKTYLDTQRIECDRHFGDLIEKLTSGHKCLSFLPHGDSENESDKYCPLNEKNLYTKRVRYYLNKVIRFILERLIKEKPPVVVFLCYNEYAIDGKHSPVFLHESLECLYQSAVEIIGEENVIFFTDRATSLGSISCCHIPLTLLCDHLYQSCNDLSCKLPILLPSVSGELQIEDIAWIQDDFDIVHKKIDEHELDKRRTSKIKKLGKVNVSNEELDRQIIEEITIDFLRGNCISWIGLSHQIDIKRELADDIKEKINSMQSSGQVQRTTRIFELYHETGAGASTLARRILWDFRKKFICLILNENFSYSADAVVRLTKLYEKCNCTILLLVDEDLQQYNTELLTYQIQSKSIPLILFRVIRTLQRTSNIPRSSFLGCSLNANEASRLKTKYKHHLSEKITKREKDFHEAKAFNVLGELVIAHDKHWSFCQLGHHNKKGVIRKRCERDLVEIKWFDGKIEQCPLDTVQLETHKDEMQSFMFYGIFYLLEEYRNRINDHVQRKLGKLQNSELKFLAHISLLFAYDACYSLPQACFGERVIRFSILDNVPTEAHEFVFVNKEGSFRIVHTIVAHQIIKFYTRNNVLSDFVIEFLRRFIPNGASVNQKLRQAVSTLLWTRRPILQDEDGSFLDGRRKRQDFSPLICVLHKEDAQRVLLEGTDIFDNDHSFGHLARFYAIAARDFDQAKQCMKKAIALASEQSEGTIYNMYGDIYRYELTNVISKISGKDDHMWKYADELHSQACEKYSLSSISHRSLSHPYYGELKVRLDYLKCIRKFKFSSDHYDRMFMKYLLTNETVLNSDGRCIELLEWLENFVVNGDGGKDIGSDDIASIRKHQQTLYDLMGKEKRQQCISITEELLKLPRNEVNHPAARRKYINLHLIRKKVVDIPMDKRIKMLDFLVRNIKEEGYKADTLKYWLKFASSLPSPYSDVNIALDMLKEWGKRVQPSDIAFVKFYLYIFYFLAALNCSPNSEQFNTHMRNYEKEEAACRRENSSEKTAHWITKWLARDGNGIGCLCSEKWQDKLEHLKMFFGKIGNIERDRKQCHISFKGFSIFFDLKDLKSTDNVRNSSKVQFGIGFSCTGVRAINISLIKENPSAKSTSIQISTSNEHLTSAGGYNSDSSSSKAEENEASNQGTYILYDKYFVIQMCCGLSTILVHTCFSMLLHLQIICSISHQLSVISTCNR